MQFGAAHGGSAAEPRLGGFCQLVRAVGQLFDVRLAESMQHALMFTRTMRYRVELYPSDDGVAVSCPRLPGCWSQGATEAEALDNIRVAIQEYLAAQLPGLNDKGLDRLYVQVFVDGPPTVHGETRARAMRVLASLPARDAEILRAVFIEAEDKDKVASRFGVDREYLRILLRRAVDKFRSTYLEHEAELRSRAMRTDRDTPEVREVEVSV